MQMRIVKIILMIIFGMIVASSSLLDNEAYQEMKQEMREKGVKCYEKSNGNVYCKDKYGNVVY